MESHSTCGCLCYRNQALPIPRKGDPHLQKDFVSKWGFFPYEGARIPGSGILLPLKHMGKCSQSPSTCRLLVLLFCSPGAVGMPVYPAPSPILEGFQPFLADCFSALQMMRDERDQPLLLGETAAGARPSPHAARGSVPFFSPYSHVRPKLFAGKWVVSTWKVRSRHAELQHDLLAAQALISASVAHECA